MVMCCCRAEAGGPVHDRLRQVDRQHHGGHRPTHLHVRRYRKEGGNHHDYSLKGQCHEIFASGFFHESSSSKPLKKNQSI